MIGVSDFKAGAFDKRYFGVAIAIVTDNVDPEKQGRVKVRFPWYDDRTESGWCRVVYLNAGPGHGFIAVPERDTEVLVAFEHGDMRRPYVLGALYNGVDAPPTDRQQDSEKDEKLFQTHAGNRILLRDTAGDTLIEVETKGGQKLTLRDQGNSGGTAITAETSGGYTLALDEQARKATLTTGSGQPTVELDAGANKITITTGSGQSVTIDGTGTLTLEATTVKVEATQVELGSAATQKVILGDAFMTYFNTHVHNATTLGAPTSPPVVSMNAALLSNVTKTG
jgi:uncharacterized protein involved in type VI secretion and phage assembly